MERTEPGHGRGVFRERVGKAAVDSVAHAIIRLRVGARAAKRDAAGIAHRNLGCELRVGSTAEFGDGEGHPP